MRGLILTLALITCFVSNDAQAQEDHGTKVYKLKCMSPCDVFTGVGCYLKDATCRTVKGTGMILSAPFKAKFCFPKPDTWLYKPARFNFVPSQWRRVPDPPEVIPSLEIFDGVLEGDIDVFGEPEPESESDYIRPLHYDSPLPSEFVKLVEIKF